MKKFGFWAVAAALLLAPMGFCSCSMGATTTSEMKGGLDYVQDDLREKPFKAIDIDVVASVYYTQNNGDECSVRLDYSAIKDAEFAEKLKEKLKVVYRDGEVKIGLTGRLKVPAMCSSEKNRLKIYITSPDLVKITQEGVGSFYAKTINSDRLEIDNEGVGSVTLDFFKGGNLKINNDGVGKVSAKVDCQILNVDLDGVGSVHLSGVTGKYTRHKDGVGSISDGGLKVRN